MGSSAARIRPGSVSGVRSGGGRGARGRARRPTLVPGGCGLGDMQIELLNRQQWRTNLELAIAADYIDHFYNPSRRHSSLGYLTPDEYERLHSPQPQATSS